MSDPNVKISAGQTRRPSGAPPGTRTPNPRIKSPLLRSSIQAVYQHLYASTLARYPQPAEAEYRMRTVDTGLYRDIRANMEQTWKTEGLNHYGKWSYKPTEDTLAVVRSSGRKLASMVVTIRNLRLYW
jgi:hypothetical protein